MTYSRFGSQALTYINLLADCSFLTLPQQAHLKLILFLSTDMSSSNVTSGTGGVRNLRAIFEHKPSEEQSVSPPSRGRSPAHSEASINSRPVSKVRTSFVVVERPGHIDEAPLWGLQKASDVTPMADIKLDFENGSSDNGAPKTPNSHSQANGLHSDLHSPPRQDNADEGTQSGLGGILKGSPFEASPPISRSNLNGTVARESSMSPTSQKKTMSTSRTNGTINSKTTKSADSPYTQTKSIGGRIKDAVFSDYNHRLPPVKLNTTKEAKPIKPLPTRHVPPTNTSVQPPTSPRTPRAPSSPKLEKPLTRGSAAKPAAVAESAKTGSELARKSPTQLRETRGMSMQTHSPPATRMRPSPPKMNGAKKEIKSSAPESKSQLTNVPASVAAPTAASVARNNGTTNLGRKPTVTRRDPLPSKITTTVAPAAKKASRTSLLGQKNGTDRTKPRTSAARSTKAPDDGFLARMMRPTASSAQKTHDKAAPSSPPQSKRAAPIRTAKSKARSSLTVSDEDKENSHRGQQEMNSSPSTAKTTQAEMNGDGEAVSQPLSDITPANGKGSFDH